MFSSIASQYDKTNDFLSMGIHRLWRKQSLKFAKIDKSFPIHVADLCCGTGDFLIATEKLVNKNSVFVGLDFVWNMLPIAKGKAAEIKTESNKAQNKLQFVRGDALQTPFPDHAFDLCTIGFGIRNLDSTLDGLIEMKRILKKGGIVVILEFGTPHLIGFKQIFQAYSKYLMPIIGGLISGNKAAYEYLPETSAAYPCRADFCKIMEEAKFNDIRFKSFFGGIAYCYTARN